MPNINVRASNPYYLGTKSLDGAVYELKFYWNVTTAKWYMAIRGLNNDVDVRGIAVTVGKDLLNSHGLVELGTLFCIDNQLENIDPTFAEFGSRWTLEYTER